MPKPLKSARLRRAQIVAVSFLTLAGIVNYIDRSTLSIANGPIRAEMGLTPSEMGWLLSAFSLAYAFSQLPVGAILDRVGARIMVGAGLFLWSLAQVACGFAMQFKHFMIMRGLLGIGEAPLFPSQAKVISEWFNVSERGRPTGIIVASSCIGPAIGPPVVTAIMLMFGWRIMFVITGVVGIAAAAGWYIWYRNRAEVDLAPEEVAFLEAGSITDPEPQKMSWQDWGSIFTRMTTWGIILGYMGVIYMVWLYLTWLPSYLEHARGFTVEKTGWVVAVPYLFGTVGMLSAGWIVDKLIKAGVSVVASRKWPVCIGLVGGAAFTIPAAYTPDASLAVVYICLAMYFINLASASAWTLISVVAPKHQVGSLGSIMNFGGYFAGSFAPVVTGFMVQNTGSYVNALLAAAVIAILSAVAYVLLVRDTPRSKLEQEVEA